MFPLMLWALQWSPDYVVFFVRPCLAVVYSIAVLPFPSAGIENTRHMALWVHDIMWIKSGHPGFVLPRVTGVSREDEQSFVSRLLECRGSPRVFLQSVSFILEAFACAGGGGDR